jgi:hypothetical protein
MLAIPQTVNINYFEEFITDIKYIIYRKYHEIQFSSSLHLIKIKIQKLGNFNPPLNPSGP